jgi:hypothetical protein
MGDSSSQEISTNISWTVRLEEYFASTGEKASGLAWVHKRAEAIYSTRRTYIDLPVIIGSGVIAFLNAGSQSLFTDQRIASTALGVGSLFMGILNSFGTYFGWSKRAEGHRISAIHYAKLYRFISVELSLPRPERMSPHDLLKYVKDQYDRLAEISPMVPELVIHEFQHKFKHEKVSKPEEANGLHKIDIYKDLEDDYSMRQLPDITSPVAKVKKVPSFEEMMSPSELPKMTIRLPEIVKKPELKKPTAPALKAIEEESKPVVSESHVAIEIPKSASPHED